MSWVGSVAVEGDVTRVRTESGSVWGGEARLVEEASIGVAEGADELMFGGVTSVWMSGETVYAVDLQVPAVRAYDRDGNFVMTIGGPGEGPGEYLTPTAVAVTSEGAILVSEEGSRLHTYGADGAVRHTVETGSTVAYFGANAFILSRDDVPYKFAFDMETIRGPGPARIGRVAFGDAGEAGEPTFPPALEFEPWCVQSTDPRSGGVRNNCDVPYAPRENNAFTPDLAWVVGTSDDYRFQIHHHDGRVTHVSRAWQPVVMSAAEIDHNRRRFVASIRRRDPGWEWRGAEIPDHKPAYVRFIPGRDGRLWVDREGPSRRVTTECTDDFSDHEAERNEMRPCWVADRFLDGFDAEGRYLGELRVPSMTGTEPFIDGEVFVAVVMDDDDVVRIKRYRIVLPDRSPAEIQVP